MGGSKTLSKQIQSTEENNKNEVRLNANDTDFLLKLFMDSSFKGSEVDKAHGVLSKLAILHRENLNGK